MLGMFDAYIPKFVRKFAALQPDITAAAIAYQQAVISGGFPEADHLYYLEGEKKT
jgi:3-methyl-2-oxobutanoate hydroxymethyltransferase